MYAINHAATALVLKRRFPNAPLVALLVSVQLLEVLWVVFHALGLERIELEDHAVRLGFLAYSHSVFTGVTLAVIVGVIAARVRRDRSVGVALGLGVLSHLVLDLLMHRPDIALGPGPLAHMRLGVGLYGSPAVAFAVELGWGVMCWRWFGGSRKLLAAIVALNVLDLPFMLDRPMPVSMRLATMDRVVVASVALQMFVSWIVVYRLAREPLDSRSSGVTHAPA